MSCSPAEQRGEPAEAAAVLPPACPPSRTMAGSLGLGAPCWGLQHLCAGMERRGHSPTLCRAEKHRPGCSMAIAGLLGAWALQPRGGLGQGFANRAPRSLGVSVVLLRGCFFSFSFLL